MIMMVDDGDDDGGSDSDDNGIRMRNSCKWVAGSQEPGSRD